MLYKVGFYVKVELCYRTTLLRRLRRTLKRGVFRPEKTIKRVSYELRQYVTIGNSYLYETIVGMLLPPVEHLRGGLA